MEKNIEKAHLRKEKRAIRVRNKVRGTKEKPRLSVVKTNKHIIVQLIDDVDGKTLASANSNAKEFRGTEFSKKNKNSAKALGENIAKKAKEQNIASVIFDRGPFKYHGILAAVADAARSQGLQF